MKRSVRKMYEEMLVNALDSEKWNREIHEYSLFASKPYHKYTTDYINVGDYRYRFRFQEEGVFTILAMTAEVVVREKDSSFYSDTTIIEKITFSIFSKTYWMMFRLHKDYNKNKKNKKNDILIDIYKSYKDDEAIKEIDSLRRSIARLSEIEKESKEKMAELKLMKDELEMESSG